MTGKTRIALGLGLVAMLLSGCAAIGLIASLGGSAIAGTVFLRGQTVDRTFVAPMPEVKEACRRALETMAFTIKQEGPRGNEYLIFAAAETQYEVEVTLTPITSKTTKGSVNADTLPERDRATGLEILNQMAAVLSPPPPISVSRLRQRRSPVSEHDRTPATKGEPGTRLDPPHHHATNAAHGPVLAGGA